MLSLTHMPVRCCSAREYLCASSTTTTSPRRFPRIFQSTTLCDHRCTQPQTGSMKSRIPARLLRLMPATELCSAWLSARGRGGVILGSRSQATAVLLAPAGVREAQQIATAVSAAPSYHPTAQGG